MSDKEQVQVDDLPKDAQELTPEQAEDAKGGIALLLPAVQKVRSPAAASDPQDGGEFQGDGSVRLGN